MSRLPPIPEDTPEPLKRLMEEVDRRQKAFDALWPAVMDLRRRYFEDRSAETKAAMQAIIGTAEIAREGLDAAWANLSETTGINLDDLEETPDPPGDPFPRLSWASVMAHAPATGDFIEDYLPQAIEAIERHAPPGWLEEEPADWFRLSAADDDEPISIVKGIRLKSERPKGHRLRQAMTLAKDYLAKAEQYDHFGGAMAVSQLAQFGRRLDSLTAVMGAQKKLGSLFSDADPDATMFELLVASACAAKGRDMAFVEPSTRRSPDLRCRDDFNMVVECKRSDAITDYEVAEERRMRDLFRELRTAAVARGQFGAFELVFSCEYTALNLAEVANACILQRLTPHPQRALDYSWGSVAFHPLPARCDFTGITKAYSPIMIEQLFGWSLEMPEWDGIVCQIDGPAGVAVDQARSPIGMAWRVDVDAAIIKRSRAPMALFNKALSQVSRGEFGLVYIALTEGARPDMADNRTETFIERIQEWEHDAGIRIPAVFLARLFAIPRNHGDPDLIESTVKFRSPEGGGDDWVFRDYPTNIFTSNG